jgi:K+-sensing histidine kinase KdpD
VGRGRAAGKAVTKLDRLREIETWIAWIRVGAIVFAIFEVGVFSTGYPPEYEAYAWLTTGVFSVGAVCLWALIQRAYALWVGLIALVFDACAIAAYATVYSFEYGNPARWALILVVVEAALRFGYWGGSIAAVAVLPYLVFIEWWRSYQFGGPGFLLDRVTFPFGIFLLTGVIAGWLVNRLGREAERAAARAAEAEELRDELARRVDLLEAANRCARALASSLDVDEAFSAFIRELGTLIAFERVSIVLVDGDRAETMAAAGRGVETVFPPTSVRPVAGSVLEEILEGKVVYRETMRPPAYPEEEQLLELGLECRLLAPLQVGPRTIGMLAVMRDRPHAFAHEEVALVALLGRQLATAVQNIHSFEAERRTVEELRRLSALRADFVSLVSHELRSPMAAVIGAARTLEGRWRVLSAEHRGSFLALIADETTRLSNLIADVLDTSRIEAGTFSYSFRDVDVGKLVEEVVAAAAIGQDEVRVHADVYGTLPVVRGDAERLRQVLHNLVDNAVKFSPADGDVHVRASTEDGHVRVDVLDQGPGVPPADRRLIFEKFGRSTVGETKPGSGLGLFIARSIAEAHGGELDVETSRDQPGATFTLLLPLEGDLATDA